MLACSKGAEFYSIAWAIGSAPSDLKLIYSFESPDVLNAPNHGGITDRADVTWNTDRDQNAPIFERMTAEEVGAMCEVNGDRVKVKSWLKEESAG